MRYASREESDETDRLLRLAAERRRAEGMVAAPEPTAAERDVEDAQLPWLDGYARTCWRYRRASSLRPKWRWAEAGARIARGLAPGFVQPPNVDDNMALVDADHPGHTLTRVRGRFEIVATDERLYAALRVGRRDLTTYPDGGVFSLYPDHPMIAALATARDGECVLITGQILGGYTTGHLWYDLENLSCGRSFWTRIDKLEPCSMLDSE